MSNLSIEETLKLLNDKKENYFESRNEVEELREVLRDSLTKDTSLSLKEKNALLFSIGEFRLPNKDKPLLDEGVRRVVLSRLLSTGDLDTAWQEASVILKRDLTDQKGYSKSRHPREVMVSLMDDLYKSKQYKEVIGSMGLAKTSKCLGLCRSPHSAMLRMQKLQTQGRILERMSAEEGNLKNTVKFLQKEMKNKDSEIAIMALQLDKMEVDLEEIKEILLGKDDKYERYCSLIEEYPNLTEKQAAAICHVSVRTIRRYKARKVQEEV